MTNKFLSDEQSKHFASIFKRMQFFSVDDIELSYSYQSNRRKLPVHSSLNGSYIDETAAKFYILKDFEKFEIHSIRTMVNFLIKDVTHQMKLSSFIENILRTHQKDRQQGLNKIREKYTVTYESKWIIPESKLPLEEEKPEVKVLEEKIDVTAEEIQAVASEPSIRPKLPPKKPADTVEQVHAITDGSLKPVSTYAHPVQNHPQVSSQSQISSQSDVSCHSQVSSHPQVPSPSQPVDSNRKNDKQTMVKETNKDPLKPTSFRIAHQISSPKIQFEKIIISNLTDLDLSTINSNVETLSTDTDELTDYRGEQLVYLLLKRQYPNDEIKWMNEKEESGKPFDIYRKLSNGLEEFIEVKTTKNITQQSFFVSIAELKFFLTYPTNSSIYRVYYADPVESSTITKINRIEENLQQRRLKLKMMIYSKSNNKASN